MDTAIYPPAWAACLAVFERELTPQQYATWIRPLACADEAGTLRLTAPNRFVLQWVKDRFGGRIQALARDAAGGSMAVEFAVADAAARESNRQEGASSAPVVNGHAPRPLPVDSPGHRGRSEASPGGPVPSAAPTSGAPALVRKPEPGGLNPSFNFASFVAGKANQLARAAGLQVAEHPTVLQPALHLRRRRPGQDAPDAGDRQPDPDAQPEPPRSATSTPSTSSPTWCAPTSTRLRRFQALLPLARPAARSTTSSSSAARAARRKSSSTCSTR